MYILITGNFCVARRAGASLHQRWVMSYTTTLAGSNGCNHGTLGNG